MKIATADSWFSTQTPSRPTSTSPCNRICPGQAVMQRVSIGSPSVSGSLPSTRG